jgi:ABC-type amino acid transport substrate-binding protein
MRKLALLMAVVALGACDRSKPELEKTLVQVQQISAEKDSLLRDVMATTQFIADANTELSKVRMRANSKPTVSTTGENEGKLSPSEQRAALLTRIKGITASLNEAESRLAASRKRVSMLDTNNAGLKTQLAAYDSTITSFKNLIESQKSQVADLTAQVNALTTENTQLKEFNVALTTDKNSLTTERDRLTTERNTVYYVIGTKDDLLKKKIIVQTGGMMGIGKVQVPARELNPADFTSIDKTAVANIPLPNAEKSYKIVTRQDVSALEMQPDEKGRIKTAVAIKDPVAFWGPSKFLIIIEQ